MGLPGHYSGIHTPSACLLTQHKRDYIQEIELKFCSFPYFPTPNKPSNLKFWLER